MFEVDTATLAGYEACKSPKDFSPCSFEFPPAPAEYLNVMDAGRFLFSLSQMVQPGSTLAMAAQSDHARVKATTWVFITMVRRSKRLGFMGETYL